MAGCASLLAPLMATFILFIENQSKVFLVCSLGPPPEKKLPLEDGEGAQGSLLKIKFRRAVISAKHACGLGEHDKLPEERMHILHAAAQELQRAQPILLDDTRHQQSRLPSITQQCSPPPAPLPA
jgi:hypothetical protein